MSAEPAFTDVPTATEEIRAGRMLWAWDDTVVSPSVGSFSDPGLPERRTAQGHRISTSMMKHPEFAADNLYQYVMLIRSTQIEKSSCFSSPSNCTAAFISKLLTLTAA